MTRSRRGSYRDRRTDRLAQLADIRLESGPVQVSREQAQRLVVVSANVAGRNLGGFAE